LFARKRLAWSQLTATKSEQLLSDNTLRLLTPENTTTERRQFGDSARQNIRLLFHFFETHACEKEFIAVFCYRKCALAVHMSVLITRIYPAEKAWNFPWSNSVVVGVGSRRRGEAGGIV
jgi:glutathione S-transferase